MRLHLPLLIATLFLLHETALAAEEKTLSLPPASLAQWYKPQNKRQVWLHTMFRLRREMLAVADYTRQEDEANLDKWVARLVKDYRSIADMVPEWKDELALDWADRLEHAATQADYVKVEHARKKLENTCNSCHREFQPQAALLYRSPDFHTLEITDSTSGTPQRYPELMQALSDALNRIKIASEDGKKPTALDAMTQLQSHLVSLGTSCPQCHTDNVPRERILGPANQHTLAKLETSIRDDTTEETDKLLGEIGVAICARCHGVHRTLADMKALIAPGQR